MAVELRALTAGRECLTHLTVIAGLQAATSRSVQPKPALRSPDRILRGHAKKTLCGFWRFKARTRGASKTGDRCRPTMLREHTNAR
jgi:hypothetical protein